MSRYVKKLLEDEIAGRLKGVSDFVVVSTKGVTGNENNQMRGELKKKNIRLLMLKNSLAKKAFGSLGMAGACSLLSGPCSVAYGGDSVVDIAKEMAAWSKRLKAVELKGAYLEGAVLDANGAVELSKMPSRVELQGRIVILANSPGKRVCGAIMGPAGIIAGCIKTIIDKGKAKEAA
ncbi:MAG: 50S ribosomal protein L10 [Planctomycetota bacterium]